MREQPASGALFKQTGGRVVRRGWRQAITNHWLLAFAGTWHTRPRYAERGTNGTCRSGFHDNQAATLAAMRCGVTGQMGADVLNHLVELFDVYMMESREQKKGRGMSILV